MSRMKSWISKTSVEGIADVMADPECSGKLLIDIWRGLGELADGDSGEDMERLMNVHKTGGVAMALVDAIRSGKVNKQGYAHGLPEYLVTEMAPFDEDPTIGDLINKADLCLDNKRKGFPTVLTGGAVYFTGEEARVTQWVPTEEQAKELAEGEV
jgi:hypothetical protein